MKRLLSFAAIAALAAVLLVQREGRLRERPGTRGTSSAEAAEDVFASAFAEHRGNFVVEGSGTVARILSDDNDGSRHQRFIVALASGQTLLIAHNIDLAPRVEPLGVGDKISFKGEYEWSDKGGAMHWTHHDPSGKHEAGWIRHNGRTFQ